MSSLGIGDDQRTLHEAARAFLADRCPPAVPRGYLDDAPDVLPSFWAEMADLGWLGIHLPEQFGGGGGVLGDVAVVLEEMGRVLAPGPYLPTVLAAAVVDRLGRDDQRAALLPDLATGAAPSAVALGPAEGTLEAGPEDGGTLLHGIWPLVPAGGVATLLLLPARMDGRLVWGVVDRAELDITPRPSVDQTRRVADVVAHGVAVPPERVLAAADGDGATYDGDSDSDLVERLATRLMAAEAVGSAAWCVDTAAAHAREREQFGRPIGQFQAVKHRCADMLCALELARAAAWDAARSDDPLADQAAAALAPQVLLRTAEGCIQVLGGMGFTWEHDAHLYLKRALALRSLVGPPPRWHARAVAQARSGHRRSLAVDLPPEAEAHRSEVKDFLAQLRTTETSTWRVALAEAGYLAPHWPHPWGRGAGALEQLVIDEEFAAAHVQRPHLQIAAWILPTLIAYGTDEQQARWLPPTLRGEITWCQLFSEPGAGSDLASLTTRATRVDGGWHLNGQKVWTTMAGQSDVGFCLARTDEPDQAGPDGPRKHEGITSFVVDMRSADIEIRPLRELTGYALFNEVFLTDVFVADDAVVGPIGGGWQAARTMLGNERVSMGSGSSFGLGEEALLGLLDQGAENDPRALDEVGRLLVEAQALAVLGVRITLRALSTDSRLGTEPGPEASVRKLLAAEHDQKVQEAGWSLLGHQGAATDGAAASWVTGYLANRCLTIAGGTSEIQRNVIAERLLGLPRDP
jgi:alkylation response protein AidB-like acyl-CoA dehydrogenase